MTDRQGSLLDALCGAGVDFVVVGGMAAVLQGAPVVTHDLDICPARDPANVGRLHELLGRLDARYRGQPAGRVLRPDIEALSGPGHHNLATALGPLDVLGELEPGEGFAQLLPHCVEIRDGSIAIRVLGLRRLIEIKKRSSRAKDRLMLPALLAALEEG